MKIFFLDTDDTSRRKILSAMPQEAPSEAPLKAAFGEGNYF